MSTEVKMENSDIVRHFKDILRDKPDTSDAAAAIETVLHFLEHDRSDTIQEITAKLPRIKEVLCKDADASVASIKSGCEQVTQYMTKSDLLDFSDMEYCKKIMVQRGRSFLRRLEKMKVRIAAEASCRIFDGMRIMTHSRSKNVLRALKAAHDDGRRFKVYVTESRPDESGLTLAKELREHGLDVTVILDASVGYIMEQIDLVMVGAEGVVENGGIVNKIGTYSIGLAAKALNKPLVVLCESCKFVRFYPLQQSDIPDEFKHFASTIKKSDGDLGAEHPLVDYTPPHLITYLFTDLGILVPPAVTDALIQLYL